MLMLLPPSEGKTAPAAGSPVDLDALSFPGLTGDRVDLLAALVRLCRSDPAAAATALGLGPTQAEEIAANAVLPQAPAAAAREVYSGVLYEALGLRTLGGATARRADDSLVITSALWGLLRPGDQVPAYRLGGGVTLPRVGGLAGFWRPSLRALLPSLVGDQLVVDLRSSTYAAFWRPVGDVAAHTVVLRIVRSSRTAATRILHERAGTRVVVSHHNKATKGHLVRALLDQPERAATPAEFADLVAALGWKAELAEPARPGTPWTLDIIV